MISALIKSTLEYVGYIKPEPPYIKELREFDPDEYEADFILSLSLEELGNSRKLNKLANEAMERKVRELVKQVLKHQKTMLKTQEPS